MQPVQHVDAPTWPPRVAHSNQGVQRRPRGSWYDQPPWPTRGSLDYSQKIITVGLLLLALPWLTSKLLTNPGAVLTGLGQRQVSKAAGGG